MRNILFFLVYIMVGSSAIAANTTLAFVNGITTDKVRAALSRNALKYRFCISNAKSCDTVEFKTFYNSTEGFADDNGELKVQASLENQARILAMQALRKEINANPTAILDVSSPTSPYYAIYKAYLDTFLHAAYFDDRAKGAGIYIDRNVLGTDPDNANNAILKNYISIALETIAELKRENSTRKVVLVPHSQGNYFAQAVAATIRANNPELASNLSVMGVAAVSTIAQIAGEHISLLQDRALWAHDAAGHIFDTAGNFDGGWSLGTTPEKDDRLQEGLSDLSNHGFLETYLGMRMLLLPIDGFQCRDIMVPTELAAEARQTKIVDLHWACQEKYQVINKSTIIGIGSTFPSLRGIKLHSHISQKIEDSIRTPAFFCGTVSSPKITDQQGPSYFATISQPVTFTATYAPKTGAAVQISNFNWVVSPSDIGAEAVNQQVFTKTFATSGTKSVSVTPVLADGTVCTGSTATSQVTVLEASGVTAFIDAANFLPSSQGIAVYPGNTCQSGLVFNSAPYLGKPNIGEWAVAITDAATYKIDVEYTAAESRPVQALMDGVVFNNLALVETTGSWCRSNLVLKTIGTVSLSAGNHILRLQRPSVFPHLSRIVLTKVLSGAVQVNANNPAGTFVTVPSGVTSCTFNASGTWNYGIGMSSGPDGVASFTSNAYVRVLPTAPWFSLITQISSGYVAIGSNRTLAVTPGQSLAFMINEGLGNGLPSGYADNSSALSLAYTCN